MNHLLRSVLVFVSLVLSLGGSVVHQAMAQSDADTFQTYGARPHDLPDDAAEMIVDSVVDGDTLHLTYPDDDWYYEVRIIGIDTPEKAGPYTTEECYGQEATAELTRLLPPGTAVFAEMDVSDEDRYGRWLRHVWLPYADNGVSVDDEAYLVSEIMVRGGWADAKQFRPDNEYDKILIDSERDARKSNAGIWGAC